MDTLFLALRVVISLAAVLGLLWAIQKKVATKTGRGAKQAKHVTVVARQGISGKASVAVVDVEGVRYVLGVTEQSVSVIGSTVAPVDATVTAISAAPAAGSAFAAVLEQTPAPIAVQPDPEPVVLSPRRAARAAAATPVAASPIAGSILSASTWKQAAAAMRTQKRA
ncbi:MULTISPECIES: FliO/MopB family protein [unclassified Frondihabitans]|uniref:FliO/MopB family protein n=1 Tax=unclassified Frondihabitans TaxID=2626248 RepID=UPI0006F9721B|nr:MULTISPECIES: flagellar biosynthetic protein FliO [unclassified Frondihabitans]KQQ25689.1 hypothetical protein ASF54_14975 [Frondihabitans sp. Leaf304]RPE77500.1 flagellar protein FliO/FliZ [Frondihabitans sp. PhB153]RPF07777.1 flagellar protein FliO/FliZ [Frondihabitans sp. PhB161]